MLRIVLLALLLIVAYVLPARAKGNSHLAVVVTDSYGQPLAGQEIKVTNSGDRAVALFVTDSAGQTTVGNLQPGFWQVEACGQQATFESSEEPSGGLLEITCHRQLLPVIRQ